MSDGKKLASARKTGNPLQNVGRRADVIPYYDTVGSGDVIINPVSTTGDNGGLQHTALNALYQPQDSQPSLGELIAFSSIMNGKDKFGGISDVPVAMAGFDKANAYANQSGLADTILSLMAKGRSYEEARYEALSNSLLSDGLDRSAIAVALPEYAKQADMQAMREIDTISALGGNYKSNNNSLGYVPLGIRDFGVDNGQGYMTVGNHRVTGVPPELLLATVYGAINGKGSASSKALDLSTAYDNARLLLSGNPTLGKGGYRGKPIEQYEKEQKILEERQKNVAEHRQKLKNASSGNTTGTGYNY